MSVAGAAPGQRITVAPAEYVFPPGRRSVETPPPPGTEPLLGGSGDRHEEDVDRVVSIRRSISEVVRINEEEGSGRTRRCAFWTLGLIVVGVAVLYVHSKAGGFLRLAMDWVAQFGLVAAVYISLGTAMVTVTGMPTFPLMVGTGVLFSHMYGLLWGTVLGVATMLSGIWLGSVTAFGIGRYLCAECGQEALQKHSWMKHVQAMIDAEGLKVVLLLRASPMLPAEVFNYACAAMPLPFWKFAVGSLGSVVPILFWVFTSAQGAQLARDCDRFEEDEGAGKHRLTARIASFTFMAVTFVVDVLALYLMYKKHGDRFSRGISAERGESAQAAEVASEPDADAREASKRSQASAAGKAAEDPEAGCIVQRQPSRDDAPCGCSVQ